METMDEKFIPIEQLFKMFHLEQYVHRVIDYTQRYNNSNSSYYSPENLIGKYEKYPLYGDIPEAYSFRTYGNWWKRSESAQQDYRPQDADPVGAEDYITIEFESAVVPRDICIYEVYNPGSVVRIWGSISNNHPWVLLWEGSPQICGQITRKFHPDIKRVNILVNTLRIEFNSSYLDYHSSIEAVLLGGYQPSTGLQHHVILKGLVHKVPNSSKLIQNEQYDNHILSAREDDLFLNLPYEVILHIFQYLDFKSLSRCARVNKRWNEASNDTFLFQNLNLKPYWHLVDRDTLRFFMNKCRSLKKLDLSWCGNNVAGFGKLVSSLIGANSGTLTHVSLGNCKFISPEVVMEISCCKELLDLRLKNTNAYFGPEFVTLDYLNKLISLDLTSSSIDDDDLIMLLKANPNLQHLIIDLCENLWRLDEVATIVAKYNKHLKTWHSWKTLSLTADGVKQLSNCPNIIDLDLGWCLVNRDPMDCIKFVAENCSSLNRLILSEWRGLNDQLLMPLVTNCKELIQLDLLGIMTITAEFCENALLFLPKLRLLDINFCDNIRQEEVEIWKQQYPHITIQRSLNTLSDYLH